MPIERPIAGSTEISPVLPMAVARLTPKMIMNALRGIVEAAGVEAMAGLYRASA